MLTVKCSSCSTALKLQKAPASGKIKCPKCGAIVAVGTRPAAAKPAAAPSRAKTPDDDGFDFGQVNFPAAGGANAVTEFPTHQTGQVYDGPIPGDPMDIVQEEPEEEEVTVGAYHRQAEAGTDSSKAKGTGKRSPMLLIGVIAGVLVLVIGGAAAAFMFLR